MNYEKIILELFSRVQELEEKVQKLEAKAMVNEPITAIVHENSNSIEDTETEDETIKITRNASRQYVIDRLKEVNENFYIEKGNRASGADIIFFQKDSCLNNKLNKANFYHSKSYDENFPSGWHTVKSTDIENEDIDLFIFNVEYKQEFSTFLFTRKELQYFIQNKEMDQNKVYHFYFHIKSGKVLECRDNERDVSKYLNRWDFITTYFTSL